LKQIRVIERTDHSIIQTCLYNDTNVVVKRTREDLCDLDALSILIHAARDPLEGWSRSVRAVVGAPRTVWIQDGFLWELYDFYDGVCLGELVLQSRKTLNGSFLRFCTESLVNVLFCLRKSGLVHRDLNPFNPFSPTQGNLGL
jgi:hypothetical protein